MYTNQKEIEDIVKNFTEKNHLPNNLFEVSTISYATGGEREVLQNTTKVHNTDCTYVIKYYQKLDIIVIWNYAKKRSMSYSYKNIKSKLADGVKYGDKGSERHNNKQSRVYFDKGDGLVDLLKMITNPI